MVETAHLILCDCQEPGRFPLSLHDGGRKSHSYVEVIVDVRVRKQADSLHPAQKSKLWLEKVAMIQARTVVLIGALDSSQIRMSCVATLGTCIIELQAGIAGSCNINRCV